MRLHIYYFSCHVLRVFCTGQITDESLKNLGLCHRLEELLVGGISFDCLKGITGMPNLRDLNVGTGRLSSENFVDLFKGNF
jgi:hypothetical protein